MTVASLSQHPNASLCRCTTAHKRGLWPASGDNLFCAHTVQGWMPSLSNSSLPGQVPFVLSHYGPVHFQSVVQMHHHLECLNPYKDFYIQTTKLFSKIDSRTCCLPPGNAIRSQPSFGIGSAPLLLGCTVRLRRKWAAPDFEKLELGISRSNRERHICGP